jgi:pimeloyl-ACP methyl ester carboxylesterase
MSAVPPRRRGALARPDCTIAYEVTGEGPAIVFAHGLGGNHMSWFQQVAHFAQRFACVTFAHRGFAPSTVPPGGLDPARYANDLAALVAELSLTDFRLVAQSMGGWTCVEYGLTRPAGLKALVLAATTGTIGAAGIGAPFATRHADWEARSAAAFAGFVRDGIHPAAGARMAAEQPAMNLLYRHIDDQNAALDKQALGRKLMASRTRATEELSGIPCPVLLLAGEEDLVISPVLMEAVAAVNGNAAFASIPQAGHSGYFERPEVFNRIVEGFLAHA